MCPIGAHWVTHFNLEHTFYFGAHCAPLGHTFHFGTHCDSLEQRAIRCGSTPGTPGWGSPPGPPVLVPPRVGVPQGPLSGALPGWSPPRGAPRGGRPPGAPFRAPSLGWESPPGSSRVTSKVGFTPRGPQGGVTSGPYLLHFMRMTSSDQ